MTRTLLLISSWIGRAFSSWLSTCRRPLAAEVAALRERNERLRAENDLLRARLERIDPHRRPHFLPWERLGVLWHRARYGLSLDAAARAFVVSIQTLVNWTRDVREGVTRLVTTRAPMNKLPDLVRELALRLRFEWPKWGSRRIAGILGRLGFKASRTSVQRFLRRRPPRPRKLARAKKRPIVARRAGHLWFIDFTRVTSFFRNVVVGAVVDAFSRRVLAMRACRGEPDEAFACRLAAEAIRRYGKPRWIVTDQGTQFTSARFTRFLAPHRIRRRFGAVASSQSVATIERFWKSLKSEFGDRLSPWLPLATIERRLSFYRFWFNSERVHAGLRFRTPDNIWLGRAVRPRYRRTRAILAVRMVGGDPSLPVLRLRAVG
jgi:putative transposase